MVGVASPRATRTSSRRRRPGSATAAQSWSSCRSGTVSGRLLRRCVLAQVADVLSPAMVVVGRVVVLLLLRPVQQVKPGLGHSQWPPAGLCDEDELDEDRVALARDHARLVGPS